MALPTDFAVATDEWPALRVLADAHGAKAAENLYDFLADLQVSDPERFQVEYTAFEAVWGGADETLGAVQQRETAYEMSQSLSDILTEWDKELFVASVPVLSDAAVRVWQRFASQLDDISRAIRANLPTPGAPSGVVDYTDESSATASERTGAGGFADNRGIVI